MYDMHIHSIFSDGRLSPEEILNKLKKDHFKGSITDHDNFDTYRDSKYKESEHFIPGIEFGITYKGEEIHILAYYIDTEDNKLIQLCEKLQEDRNNRIIKTIYNLNGINIDITLEEVQSKAGGTILSRSHIAELLIEKGYVSSMKDAFVNYLIPGKPGYVVKKAVDMEFIIETIKNNHAVSILAHPKTIKNQDLIIELIHMGIDGIEIINSKHSYEDIIKYYKLAEKYHLLKTCGSDCHGKEYNGKILLGNYGMNEAMLIPIIHLHQLRKKGL